MAKILYAWELGGGLGHMTNMLPTARALQERGHSVELAVRHLNHAEQLLGTAGLSYCQAPLWVNEPGALPNPASYAEILLGSGYANPTGLLSLLKSWRRLIISFAPDLLIADHAPTAMLAARGLGIPTASMGAGFFSPPPQTPLPVFRFWEAVDKSRVVANEQHVLTTINNALLKLGLAPLAALADLFTGLDAECLCTWPDLDTYPQRQSGHYYGPLMLRSQGVTAPWPARTGKRLLVYVKNGYPHLAALMQGLRTSGLSGLLYLAAGLPPALRPDWPDQLRVVTQPLHMQHALAQADAVVCHAGAATVAAALLAGKPLLLLPAQAEQFINAHRASKLGAAITLVPELQRMDFARALQDIVNIASYTEHAQAFAKRHQDFDEGQQVLALCGALEALLQCNK